jgi:hypothetical protein
MISGVTACWISSRRRRCIDDTSNVTTPVNSEGDTIVHANLGTMVTVLPGYASTHAWQLFQSLLRQSEVHVAILEMRIALTKDVAAHTVNHATRVIESVVVVPFAVGYVGLPALMIWGVRWSRSTRPRTLFSILSLIVSLSPRHPACWRFHQCCTIAWQPFAFRFRHSHRTFHSSTHDPSNQNYFPLFARIPM